jgi:chromosome segregation ATPase
VSLRAWSTESNADFSAELNNTMTTMNQQKATLALESEVASLDNEEYQAAEKQSVIEINRLNSDIKDLERQQRALNKGVDRARVQADLASKRLQLKQAQQVEAKNRLKKADNEKKRADHRLSQVKAKVELAEQQLSQAKQKTRDALNGIREIEKDNSKLKSRVAQMKKMIVQEKKRKDGLRTKRVRLTEEGQRLRTQIHKLEKST